MIIWDCAIISFISYFLLHIHFILCHDLVLNERKQYLNFLFMGNIEKIQFVVSFRLFWCS